MKWWWRLPAAAFATLTSVTTTTACAPTPACHSPSGHEISGHVVAAGAGAEGWIGKAVIVPAVLPCGECDLCQRGLQPICRAQKMPGNDIQGGFASHIVVPGRGLCEVDERRQGLPHICQTESHPGLNREAINTGTLVFQFPPTALCGVA